MPLFRNAEKRKTCHTKLEQILPELHNTNISSKLYLRKDYHQILLDEESRPITAFATHDVQYKRLIYGINSAFESSYFQKQTELVITGIKNAKNVSDDIITWGTSQEQHDNTLEKSIFQQKQMV